jgi:hypothetical protein
VPLTLPTSELSTRPAAVIGATGVALALPE